MYRCCNSFQWNSFRSYTPECYRIFLYILGHNPSRTIGCRTPALMDNRHRIHRTRPDRSLFQNTAAGRSISTEHSSHSTRKCRMALHIRRPRNPSPSSRKCKGSQLDSSSGSHHRCKCYHRRWAHMPHNQASMTRSFRLLNMCHPHILGHIPRSRMNMTSRIREHRRPRLRSSLSPPSRTNSCCRNSRPSNCHIRIHRRCHSYASHKRKCMTPLRLDFLCLHRPHLRRIQLRKRRK